jgi:hypothetical protein
MRRLQHSAPLAFKVAHLAVSWRLRIAGEANVLNVGAWLVTHGMGPLSRVANICSLLPFFLQYMVWGWNTSSFYLVPTRGVPTATKSVTLDL